MRETTYRDRYLRPLGRQDQPLAEFQRAALVEVATEGQPTRAASVAYLSSSGKT